MEPVIWLPVATVNAIIFFLVDAPALYAIHRGLLALQGYYFYTRVRAGHTVQLTRSRIPIVGGELLHGDTRWSFMFVLIYIAAILCLFFATLGVDSDKRHPLELSSFNNITTLSEPFDNTTVFAPLLGEFHNLTCRTGNETHAHYWSATFNATPYGNSNYFKWVGENASCQADSPQARRVVSAQCIPNIIGNECLLNPAHPNQFVLSQKLTTLRRNREKLIHKLRGADTFESYVWAEEYNFTNTNIKPYVPHEIVCTNGRMFVYGIERRRQIFNGTVIYFFQDSSTNSWYFSIGIRTRRTKSYNETFQIREPLRLTFYGTSSIEFLFASCRQNYLLVENMVTYSLDNWYTTPTIEIFDRFLLLAMRGEPLSPSKLAYVKMPLQDVTKLDTTAIILYSIVITFAVLVFPIRELLFFLLVRSGKTTQSQLFGYEYDQMSKNYRADQQRRRDKACSGEYALLNPSNMYMEEFRWSL